MTTSGNNLPKNDMLLEIKDLRVYFELAEGTVRAIDGVDLNIRRGQMLGVVGESGCGKSMTAMSLMRLIPSPGEIASGEMLFYRAKASAAGSSATEVLDLAKLDPNSKLMRDIRGDQISMVFQEPMTALSPVLSVGYQITEAIRLHRNVSKDEARELAIDMLDRVRMPNPHKIIDDYPFQLSGGMRQRAVIAMALSCHPSLLIADEPTTALDVTTEAQILDLMRELQQELNMAIMYISHNLGVIAEMAEEVAVMYLGRIVEKTDVQTLFFNPKHPYTQGLLKSIPQLDDFNKGRLETITGVVPDPYTRLKGCPFHPRCPDFMPGTCDQIEPEIIELQPGHIVRCHLYE